MVDFVRVIVNRNDLRELKVQKQWVEDFISYFGVTQVVLKVSYLILYTTFDYISFVNVR